MNITITSNDVSYKQENFNDFMNHLCTIIKNDNAKDSHLSHKIIISNSEHITSYKCNKTILNNSICTNDINRYTTISLINKLSGECNFAVKNHKDSLIEEPILPDNCFKSQDLYVSEFLPLSLTELMMGSAVFIVGVSLGILGSMKYYDYNHYSVV